MSIQQTALYEEIKHVYARVDESIQDRLGQCYALAGRFVMDHPEYMLVHGIINGRRFGIDKDNPHAWVEKDNVAYDLVQDQELPKETYYEVFGAVPDKTYTHNEAIKMMLKHEHFGPWR